MQQDFWPAFWKGKREDLFLSLSQVMQIYKDVFIVSAALKDVKNNNGQEVGVLPVSRESMDSHALSWCLQSSFPGSGGCSLSFPSDTSCLLFCHVVASLGQPLHCPLELHRSHQPGRTLTQRKHQEKPFGKFSVDLES